MYHVTPSSMWQESLAVLTTRNKWNNRSSSGDSSTVREPRVDDCVVEIISLCYFPKIWWYKFIDSFVPLHRVLIPLKICIDSWCFAMICSDSQWFEMIHRDAQWFIFGWQSYSLKHSFDTGIYWLGNALIVLNSANWTQWSHDSSKYMFVNPWFFCVELWVLQLFQLILDFRVHRGFLLIRPKVFLQNKTQMIAQ